jgi:hypothetical protein
MDKNNRNILLFIIAVVLGIFIFANMGTHSSLGSNTNGYVTKDVYSHYGQPSTKIAVITGMHPRETLSSTVVPYVIKFYALTHNVEITNYQVTVQNNPENFDIGRSNGEGLVAQFITPNIQKSNYGLVIICHDHEKGYGEGFYIATPSMDSKSITLGSAVHALLPDFNYYQRSTNEKAKSTSIGAVTTPIASTGVPVFVYEIPEWYGALDAFFKTYALFDASSKIISHLK